VGEGERKEKTKKEHNDDPIQFPLKSFKRKQPAHHAPGPRQEEKGGGGRKERRGRNLLLTAPLRNLNNLIPGNRRSVLRLVAGGGRKGEGEKGERDILLNPKNNGWKKKKKKNICATAKKGKESGRGEKKKKKKEGVRGRGDGRFASIFPSPLKEASIQPITGSKSN